MSLPVHGTSNRSTLLSGIVEDIPSETLSYMISSTCTLPCTLVYWTNITVHDGINMRILPTHPTLMEKNLLSLRLFQSNLRGVCLSTVTHITRKSTRKALKTFSISIWSFWVAAAASYYSTIFSPFPATVVPQLSFPGIKSALNQNLGFPDQLLTTNITVQQINHTWKALGDTVGNAP